ncbi:MAG: hypothetical protein V3T83_02550 [Acidobacteriota bacterium]
MTVEEIADYCEFKNCQIRLGDPATGFIRIDGNGVQEASNYGRFLSLNELAAAPSPRKVVESATVFKVRHVGGERSLARQEFEAEYQRFLSLVEG